MWRSVLKIDLIYFELLYWGYIPFLFWRGLSHYQVQTVELCPVKQWLACMISPEWLKHAWVKSTQASFTSYWPNWTPRWHLMVLNPFSYWGGGGHLADIIRYFPTVIKYQNINGEYSGQFCLFMPHPEKKKILFLPLKYFRYWWNLYNN